MRFGKNVLSDIYEFREVWADVHGPPYIFCLLYINQILHHFDLIFFSRMSNKILWKGGPQGTLLLFLYEVSIVVLIDFIAILLTPGIFLLQIVNKNMYLIHFHSKNIIKMHFPKVGFLKFQPASDIHYPSYKLRWQQRRHNMVLKTDFQKKILLLYV